MYSPRGKVLLMAHDLEELGPDVGWIPLPGG